MNNIKDKIRLLKIIGYKYNKQTRQYEKKFIDSILATITITIGIDIDWLSDKWTYKLLRRELTEYEDIYGKYNN